MKLRPPPSLLALWLASSPFAAAASSSSSLAIATTELNEDTTLPRRHLMEGMSYFQPLHCNANLTVSDCDPANGAAILLSSLLEGIPPTNNATAAAIVPCGVCAIADLTLQDGTSRTLTAPHGLDIQGMLYIPPEAHGTLEAAHVFVQGTLKIDPPTSNVFSGELNRVTIKMTGPDENIYLSPHSDNAMACALYDNGACPLGKRPLAVVGGTLDIQGIPTDAEGDNCPAWVTLRDVEKVGDASSFARMEGGSFDSSSGSITSGPGLYNYDSGDAVTYNTIDFGSPSTVQAYAIKFGYTKGTGYGGYIEAHADGQHIGTLYPPSGGGWDNHMTALMELDILLEGTHALRLEAHAQAGVMNLNWFELTNERPETILNVGTEAASCWEMWGTDEVLLTPSTHRGNYNQDWAAARVLPVNSIDVAAGTITDAAYEEDLDDPSTWQNGMPELAAEVASLNRPVKFESVRDGPSNLHGAHLIVFHTPNVAQKVEGVEIQHFGQQGHLGRYPIHFHMSDNVAGSMIRKNVVRDSNQRCIVVHGTDAVYVENNVAYNTFGHCFITEAGDEIDNTFKDNLGSKTKSQLTSIGASDRTCSTFWVTSPRNHYIGNVAGGSEFSGWWFELLRGITSGYPVSTFTHNVAHSNNREGFRMYPKGYGPSSETYFDYMKAYSNGWFGMFIKRSQRFRIRNSLFSNNGKAGIDHHNSNAYAVVEDSSFYARLARQASGCYGEVGIKFSLEGAWSQIQIKNSHFSGYGNPPGCTGLEGLALQLENIQNMASFSNGVLPLVEGLTFESNHPAWSFGITPGQFANANLVLFLEDSNGSGNPSGNPGFFVHDELHNTAFLQGMCSQTGNKYGNLNEVLFCEGACLRTIFIDAGDLISDSRLVLTSRTDANKTYTYDRRATNARFDFLAPVDEYDMRFVDPDTGDDVYHSTTIGVGPAPVCEGHVTESSFNIAQPPPGIFPLYQRLNGSHVVLQSGVEVYSTGGIGYIDLDDWFQFRDVYFGLAGETTRMRIRYSKDTSGGTLQVRLGDRNGHVIASFAPSDTGSWGTSVEDYFDIDVPVEGLHQVTFVAKDIDHGLLSFNWVELAPPPPPTESPTSKPTDSPTARPTESPIDPGSAFTRKDAVDIVAQSGVVVYSSGIGNFDKNDWFTYDNVYFGAAGEVGQIKLNFAKGNWPGRLEVRLGDRYGQVIGYFRPWYTGSWGTDSSVEASFPIDETIAGYHQVTFKALDSSGIFSLFWWELAPPVDPTAYTLYERKEAGHVLASYRVTISGSNLGYFDRNDFALYDSIWFGNAGDVTKIRVRFGKGNSGGRIQARLDGRYGPVLGTFSLYNTGGWGNYVEAEFDIDSSVSGLHRLCFLGLDSNGLWNFDWFELAA